MRFRLFIGVVIAALLLVPIGTAVGQSPAEDQYTEQPPDPTGGTGDGTGNPDGGDASNDDDESDGSTAVLPSGGSGPTGAVGVAGGGILSGVERSGGAGGGTDSGDGSGSEQSDLLLPDELAAKSDVPTVNAALAAAAKDADGGVPVPLVVGAGVVLLAVAAAGWWGYRRRDTLSDGPWSPPAASSPHISQ